MLYLGHHQRFVKWLTLKAYPERLAVVAHRTEKLQNCLATVKALQGEFVRA